MSYCGNCGVELDPTARACPLCHTPVVNPNQPVDTVSPKPFPPEPGEVLRTPTMGFDGSGGFSDVLVELSGVLPYQAFRPEDLE